MSSRRIEYREAFEAMSRSVDLFVAAVKGKQSDLMATDRWTVKDVLCHIVFWHTNYAANYHALVLKKEPPLLEGPGYTLNEEGVKALRIYSIPELTQQLHSAQESLYESIVVHRIPQMTYKKSTMRVYSTDEFLHLVERHLNTHRKQVERAT